jgi:hypothetical protein
LLDELIADMATHGGRVGANLHQRRLGTTHVGVDSEKTCSSDFESGVVKIQRQSVHDMTVAETTACLHLLVDGDGGEEEPEQPDSPVNLTFAQRFSENKKRKHATIGGGQHMNVNFILASAAEVERLWSIASDIMQTNRRGMSPMLLEALLFLKINRRFWDLNAVRRAMNNVRIASIAKRLQADLDCEQTHDDADEDGDAGADA